MAHAENAEDEERRGDSSREADQVPISDIEAHSQINGRPKLIAPAERFALFFFFSSFFPLPLLGPGSPIDSLFIRCLSPPLQP